MMAAVVLDAEITAISLNDKRFAGSLSQLNGASTPATLWTAGPASILDDEKTALFCSSQCPGGVILKTFDAITAMRDEGHTMIGGFHSPMEWECLGILLRGRQPVIWVPARSIAGMHLKPELQPAFSAGRLLILSPFGPNQKRITAALAEQRNRVVGALADRVFVAHAAPSSRTLALCEELQSAGKPLLTIDDPANSDLFRIAAKLG
jgi:predicted Rossmann fold nucleotide-binding protein DprA/Smf involved in DNA uptake